MDGIIAETQEEERELGINRARSGRGGGEGASKRWRWQETQENTRRTIIPEVIANHAMGWECRGEGRVEGLGRVEGIFAQRKGKKRGIPLFHQISRSEPWL